MNKKNNSNNNLINTDLKLNNAVKFHEKGELDKAKDLYLEILSLNPRHFQAIQLLGTIASQKKLFLKALELFDLALEIDTTYPIVYNNKGNVLRSLGRFDEGINCFEYAIKLNPKDPILYLNYGLILSDAKKFESALAQNQKAIKLDPTSSIAYVYHGSNLVYLRRIKEAIDNFEIAIKLDDKNIEAYWLKSLALLIDGQYEKGWSFYEYRWQRKTMQEFNRKFNKPIWSGKEELKDKTILIWSEQGYGDSIQFVRYTNLLIELGAKVVLEVPKPLFSLFDYNFHKVNVINTGDILPHYDFHCPLLSLPLAFKTELSNIPFSSQYLFAENNKIEYWRNKLKDINGIKVGIVWNGGHRPKQPELWLTNSRRNIDIKIFSSSLQSLNVNFISLQKGDPAESEIFGQEKHLFPKENFHNFTNELFDFSDTAALISNLDLIISVDTSTAHLSAALGKPTWILNRYDSCWRWLLNTKDSPWYESVTLYRQGITTGWGELLQEVFNDLENLCRE